MIPPILTSEAAAQLLGVKKQTIHRWAESGFLPARRVGRKWLFSLRKLVEFVERQDEAL